MAIIFKPKVAIGCYITGIIWAIASIFNQAMLVAGWIILLAISIFWTISGE